MSIPQYSAPNAPFVGPDGRLTYAGNAFLRQVWERIGGADSWSVDDLMTAPAPSSAALDVLAADAEASKLLGEVAELQAQVAELSKTDIETQVNQLREQIAAAFGPAGIYTPTSAIVVNLGSVTPGVAFFQRMGNIVRVSGSVEITVTTVTLDTEFNLTLPIPSDLSTFSRTTLFGTAVSTGGRQPSAVFNNGTVNRATFRFSANDVGPTILTYHYAYLCK